MNIDTILWGLGIGGFTAIGVTFLVKILVKGGIEEAIKHNFAKHLEDYKSQLSREVEKLKTSLKNGEAFFSRQFEALTKLRRILRRVPPKKRTPSMDWHEACEEIAHSLSKHADDLDDFLCSYEAALPNDILRKLEKAILIANDGTFLLDWNSQTGTLIASREAIESADLFYETLKEAVLALQTVVDSKVDGRVPNE